MNKIFTTILITTFSSLVFSSQAIANRPAMAEENIAPSSVDLMMQQKHQQMGDVITLPAQEMQAGETIQIKILDMPRRGMSMDQVRNEFGQPLSVTENIGQPPITSWVYSDRVVFFEYSTVLHVVSK